MLRQFYLSISLLFLVLVVFVLAACSTAPETHVNAPVAGGASGQVNATVPASPEPSDTPVPTTTATASATATPPPTVTPTATATATPLPPKPVQLTTGGCCTGPSWLPDARRVVFVDKPTVQAPAGLYAVDVTRPLSPPQLFIETLGSYSADYALRAVVQDRLQTYVERASDGKRFLINNGGRSISFSPDGKRIAWTVQSEGGIVSNRTADIWIANYDGSEPRKLLAGLVGGGFSGWLPDSTGFLYSWRETPNAIDRVLSYYALGDGSRFELIRAERISSTAISPRGGWLAYSITFGTPAAENGFSIMSLRDRSKKKLTFFGAAQWRDDDRLLYIPFRAAGQASFELYEYNARTDQSRRLLDPAATPLLISNGDWRVSPDGRNLVFVSAVDRNLYLVNLPD